MNDLPVPEVPAIPHPFGPPPVEGVLRATAGDFRVEERLAFPLAGEGGHLYLHVEKREANTEWVARRLAARAGVKPREVGYAGLKDRRAVTRQWFSLPPERAPARWEGWEEGGYRVLAAVPHPRKLRRGGLAENRFTLVVRGIEGERALLEERLRQVARRGVPNAFGEQRFGIGGGNLADAARLLAGRAGRVPRHRRSLWLSAARSLLFNRLLAERVADGSWERGMAGELFMLEGSDRCFHAEVLDETLGERLERLDIHPTGPLPGRGREEVTGPCRELEERLTAEPPGWREALVRLGLEAERRPLRVAVRDLQWRLEGDDLHLAFTLRRGSYATAVVGQIVRYRTP